jgi:hypothetical protein
MAVRNVLIVGGPRSGKTSLRAAFFARCGYYVGAFTDARRRKGDRYNLLGYFEAHDVVAHNVALLEAVGYPTTIRGCSRRSRRRR